MLKARERSSEVGVSDCWAAAAAVVEALASRGTAEAEDEGGGAARIRVASSRRIWLVRKGASSLIPPLADCLLRQKSARGEAEAGGGHVAMRPARASAASGEDADGGGVGVVVAGRNDCCLAAAACREAVPLLVVVARSMLACKVDGPEGGWL